MEALDPHDRDTWRPVVRSAVRAAIQLHGRGPTDADIAPVYLHVNKKSDDDGDDDHIWLWGPCWSCYPGHCSISFTHALEAVCMDG